MLHRQNYLAKMEQKKEDKIAAGLVSEGSKSGSHGTHC